VTARLTASHTDSKAETTVCFIHWVWDFGLFCSHNLPISE